MPALQLCHKFYDDTLSSLHSYRREGLIDATSAVINGASLNISSIAQHLPGRSTGKHKVKRVDRLLGNTKLQACIDDIYHHITIRLTQALPELYIAVDWTSWGDNSFHLLRASLIADGRSLPLLNRLVPKALQANPDVHDEFLQCLYRAIGGDKRVVIITDGGFYQSWFKSVDKLGWIYVGRVRGNSHYKLDTGDWEKVSDANTKATHVPSYLGYGTLNITASLRFSGHFYLYKSERKGRVTQWAKGQTPLITQAKKSEASWRSSWLILSNTTDFNPGKIVQIYYHRMQIEQNFRDDKSPRFGFGLRTSGSKSIGRLSILAVISTLSTLVMWLCGFYLEGKKIHLRYQANTIKERRVLSFITLTKRVLIQEPSRLRRVFFNTILKKFIIFYKKKVLA